MKTLALIALVLFVMIPCLTCAQEENNAWQNAVGQASSLKAIKILVAGENKVDKLDVAAAGKLWKVCRSIKMLEGPECRCLPQPQKQLVFCLENAAVLTIQLVQDHWFQAVFCYNGRVGMFYLKDSDNSLGECVENIMNPKPKKTMCDKCAGMMHAMAIGKCSLCEKGTSSISFKLCRECAQKRGECQVCGKPLQ